MAVIADIVNELNERNVSAKVVVIKRKDDGKPPPVIHTLRSSPIFFDSPEDCVVNFEQAVFKQGIVIAATAELVPVVRKIAEGPGREDLLFAQSLDTELTDDPDISERMKKNIKAMSGKIIANSEWLQNHLEKEFKVKTLGFVRPGVNHDLFYPRNRDAGDDRKTVLFSLLRTYTHKGYERGVEVAQALSKLAKRNGKNIRLMAYGVLNIPECPEVIGLGDLNPGKMANLMGQEVDIFCDPAHIHTYGLPSIEAMISGAVPVLWDNYGVNEYGHDGNAVILPFSASPEKVANEIFNFLKDDLGLHRLEKYRESGLNTHQSRTKSVTEFIDLLEKSYDLYDPKRKIAVVTPHLRKHGGPSTILHMANEIKDLGHEVELVTLYPDINPEVIEMCRVPVNLDYKNLGEYDVLISNSDNPENALFVMNPKIKKKVMLKLSHNPRFLSLENESLKLPWDAIMTSTQWLKDVCLNPTKEEGWNYTPKDASRIGWYHYGHEIFSCPPKERQYGDLSNQLVICGLAHQHPLKGTQESLDVMYKLKQQFVDQIHMTMVGEWPQFQQNHPKWLQYFFSLNRSSMAQLFRKIDIWICTSKTEGLGRLLLENMSASVAVVTLDTGAEFAKHRENCMVVNSEAEMTNAIVELIKNPELRMEICANAHETAKQYADPTEFRQNLRSVIQGVYE
jgi:glycosyltransferase involved in cell wall biosynthesis